MIQTSCTCLEKLSAFDSLQVLALDVGSKFNAPSLGTELLGLSGSVVQIISVRALTGTDPNQ